MTMKKTTGYVTEMRHCSGSQRFGIEPHEAPISTFPKQPSRKDGLGVMCAEHWKAYVKDLTADRKTRQAAVGAELAALATTPEAPAKAKSVAKRAPKASANATKVADAEAIIAEVDTLAGAEHVKRVGDADVQAALETTAAARDISKKEA